MEEDRLEKQYNLITDDNSTKEEILEYYKYLYSITEDNKEEILQLIKELEKDK